MSLPVKEPSCFLFPFPIKANNGPPIGCSFSLNSGVKILYKKKSHSCPMVDTQQEQKTNSSELAREEENTQLPTEINGFIN